MTEEKQGWKTVVVKLPPEKDGDLPESFELHKTDVKLIKYVRELGYGKLSEVEVQGGHVIMIKRAETKIKMV